MNRKNVIVIAVAAMALLAIAVAPIAAQTPDVLKAGEYTAKVKALVCAGCGPLIVKTMKAMKEIDTVSVDQAKKTVQFTVKKDAALKTADLQKALKGAADQMGMGADYTLSELKAAR